MRFMLIHSTAHENFPMTVNIKSLLKRVKDEKSRLASTEEKRNTTMGQACDLELLLDNRPSELMAFESAVSGVLVANNFLSVGESRDIESACDGMKSGLIPLRGRRCILLGGRVTNEGLIPSDNIPKWLSRLMHHIHKTILADLHLPCPNHALINLYAPGEGIMAHEDGPAYSGYATILSLGSACVFDFVSKDPSRAVIAQVALPVGSLLVFHDSAYRDVFHEYKFSLTDELHADLLNRSVLFEDHSFLGTASIGEYSILHRGHRTSITMRHVPPIVS
jgi:alkylated DNA repair protein alkB homolog 6